MSYWQNSCSNNSNSCLPQEYYYHNISGQKWSFDKIQKPKIIHLEVATSLDYRKNSIWRRWQINLILEIVSPDGTEWSESHGSKFLPANYLTVSIHNWCINQFIEG